MKIDGCVALVTGGNRGIGEGFVRELLAQDATRVYVAARKLADADATKCDVLHLHHLTPMNAAAQRVAPGVPVVGHLHGTELLMLEEDAGRWPHLDGWSRSSWT